MGEAAPCSYLAWDSEFFGCRIARIHAEALGPRELERIRSWAGREAIDCLYCLVGASDAGSIRAAEDGGFRLVDVRVTRARCLDGARFELPEEIGPSRPEDVSALRAIARSSHRDTRFFRDPGFPDERCQALYETWIAKSCAADADAVLVARREGRPVGYLACERDARGAGRVSLIAVSEEARGCGFGEGLVRASLGWFSRRGCAQVWVASHAGNVAAARLYERLGFLTTAVQHSYHFWPGSPSPGAAS
jgi:ribosomal protein S18 acetylase RimI-like enzyme